MDKRHRAAYQREWTARQSDEWRQQQRDYMRAYYREHAAVLRVRSREWYLEHRSEVSKRNAIAHARKRHGMEDRRKLRVGEANTQWKGDAAGYHALHKWIVARCGKPVSCESCGTNEQRRYYWANVDHCYRRDKSDWMSLCARCHYWYDVESGLRPPSIGVKRE